MDITMCCAKNCTYANKCYRYRKEPDKYNQSYCDFSYDCFMSGNYDYFMSILETKVKEEIDGD
jgi:hypothetical protein